MSNFAGLNVKWIALVRGLVPTYPVGGLYSPQLINLPTILFHNKIYCPI